MKSCKVVLTGGPCGGKTATMKYLQSQLQKDNKTVIAVDETANSLLTLDYMPGVNISALDFQNLLFKIQFLKELQKEGISNVLICDRGLLDGKVYVDEADFGKILKLNDVSEKCVASTYDVALYFKSIAYEYPEQFASERIYETPEVGISRDKRCLEIWRDKLLPITYDNLEGLEMKQQSLYLSLKQYIDSVSSDNLCSLSDYYSKEYISFLCNGIDEIMRENEIAEDVKIKTRRLVG